MLRYIPTTKFGPDSMINMCSDERWPTLLDSFHEKSNRMAGNAQLLTAPASNHYLEIDKGGEQLEQKRIDSLKIRGGHLELKRLCSFKTKVHY
jgi:hypothetical protein